jgi:hypothetical protein
MTEWQPIETALRDGTKVDLWHPVLGRFTDAYWCKLWGWSYQWGRIAGATHWMPRPAPPTEQS